MVNDKRGSKIDPLLAIVDSVEAYGGAYGCVMPPSGAGGRWWMLTPGSRIAKCRADLTSHNGVLLPELHRFDVQSAITDAPHKPRSDPQMVTVRPRKPSTSSSTARTGTRTARPKWTTSSSPLAIISYKVERPTLSAAAA